MSVRVSLCGMRMLIRVDTLRRVDNVGFLAVQLILAFEVARSEISIYAETPRKIVSM